MSLPHHHHSNSQTNTSHSLIIQHLNVLLNTIQTQSSQINSLKRNLDARDYLVEKLEAELERERGMRKRLAREMDQLGARARRDLSAVGKEKVRSGQSRDAGHRVKRDQKSRHEKKEVKADKRMHDTSHDNQPNQQKSHPSATNVSQHDEHASSEPPSHPPQDPSTPTKNLVEAVERQSPHVVKHMSPKAIRNLNRSQFKWTTIRQGHLELFSNDEGLRSKESFGSALAKDFCINPQTESYRFGIKLISTPHSKRKDDESYVLVGVANPDDFSVEHDVCGMNEYSFGIDTYYGQRWHTSLSHAFYNKPIRAGDTIYISLHKQRMTFEINDNYVGAAFKVQQEKVCPCVTFLGSNYELQVVS